MHCALLAFDERNDLRFIVHLDKDEAENLRIIACMWKRIDGITRDTPRRAAPLPLDAQDGSGRLIMARSHVPVSQRSHLAGYGNSTTKPAFDASAPRCAQLTALTRCPEPEPLANV